MLKPLILLVDDEPAVLAALEATLGPAFEEIARIEAFDRPEDVLASVPRWADENRSIAVAVVDQRMTGMTGVELLTRLRGETPAEHMKSILLTGYAGLDSAIAAKNEAGVEKYLEKPWAPAMLRIVAAESLRDSLTDSGLLGWWSFREATEFADVRAHLALRYAVYRMTPGAVFLPGDGVELDIDPYDAVAHFLSLYRETPSDRHLIGTLRVVREAPSPTLAILETIVREHPLLDERLHGMRAERLPLLNYIPHRESVLALIARIDAAGESIGEPGRLTIDPQARSMGTAGGGLLARYLIESATSFFFFFFFFFFFRHALLTCVPVHLRFYRPLGFREAEGTQACDYPLLGCTNVCLHGMADDVPSPVRARVISMAARVKRTGATCLCPTFPACQPVPYETGDFRTTNLFCPIAAAEVLSLVDAQNPEPRTQNPEPRTQNPEPERTEPLVARLAA